MCGIAGIISGTGSVRDRIGHMLDALHHRGPDDEGVYRAGCAVLGQRRLSIIDLEGGHQPIPNEDESAWIVCNGEIYNYRALRRELVDKGHRFRTESDTEVILHLYEEIGERCIDRLRGMFAFAIWDEKRQTLFAARDRLGQKPFYYVHQGDSLLFASEIKGLLAQDSGLAQLDHAALDQYLTLRLIAPPRSMFREIRKLPPAHTLRFSRHEGARVSRYWNVDFEPKHAGSETELVDEFEERLIECMKLHMVADVPVGAFLSGGLDSTLVVAMVMKHASDRPIKTFSFGLPYGRYNEAPYARMVADRYGTEHHETIIRPSLLRYLPTLVGQLDEPSDPLSICAYLISAEAGKHVKVVLGGDGGDELFGGYDRYYGNRYAGWYATVPSFIRRGLIGPALNALPDGGWYKSRAHQIKWLHELSFLSGSHRYSRSLSYFYFGGDRRQDLYGPEMRAAVEDYDPEESIQMPFEEAQALESVDRMLYSDSCVRLPDHPVMITDRMTMAHSLEARSPFMDHEIVEFAARLPVKLKVRGRSLRYMQYRLAERYLPEPLLRRPKQGFSSALPYMLRDEYRVLFSAFLRDSHLAGAGLLDQDAINRLLAEHEGGRTDNGNRLWLLLNSEVWYRMFLESASAAEMEDMIAFTARRYGVAAENGQAAMAANS